MKHRLMILTFLTLWLLFTLPEPSPTAGLTPADWVQIQSQLASQAITDWTEQAKLTASDPAEFGTFGNSVAVSGDTAVVGAFGNDVGGSAYVFVYSGGNWSQQAKLSPADLAESDLFGYSVAISGDTIVVGAFSDDDDGGGSDNSGSAYVFVRSGENWGQQTKLTASDAAENDSFGVAVAVSGDTAVIGAYGDDDEGVESGSIYIFTRSGEVWSEEAKLTASDAAASQFFGSSVAIDGETAIAGSTTDNGSAYVFVRSAGVWSEEAKLTASDGAANDSFGISMAISGDTALIGADGDDDGGDNSGSAYVFTRSAGVWSQQVKLTASDAAASDHFGSAVALGNDMALIGAHGDDEGGSMSGSAYVFVHSQDGWSEQTKLTASDAAAEDGFGWSVAVSDDTAILGALWDDDGGKRSGSAYVFTLPTPPIYLPLIVAP